MEPKLRAMQWKLKWSVFTKSHRSIPRQLMSVQALKWFRVCLLILKWLSNVAHYWHFSVAPNRDLDSRDHIDHSIKQIKAGPRSQGYCTCVWILLKTARSSVRRLKRSTIETSALLSSVRPGSEAAEEQIWSSGLLWFCRCCDESKQNGRRNRVASLKPSWCWPETFSESFCWSENHRGWFAKDSHAGDSVLLLASH